LPHPVYNKISSIKIFTIHGCTQIRFLSATNLDNHKTTLAMQKNNKLMKINSWNLNDIRCVTYPISMIFILIDKYNLFTDFL